MGRKSKWSNITNLQVQDFTDRETFSSLDVTWTEVRCHDGSVDRVALIPYCRVGDFIRGEENHPDTLCKFVCKASRSRESCPPSKRPSTAKQYSIYWCCYGPEDKRGNPQPPIRKRSYARKRGCQCHFIVKEIGDKMGVAVITYNNCAHADAKGLPCHGKYDITGDPMPITGQKRNRKRTDLLEVRDELAVQHFTHDLVNPGTSHLGTNGNAPHMELEVHNALTLIPGETDTVVLGGESTSLQDDSTSCQLVLHDIFNKLKMVFDRPPQSLSKALQLREHVDKFLNDVNAQCIMDFNYLSDPNACGSSLKRRKDA